MKSQSSIKPDALVVNKLGGTKYELIKNDNIEQITVEEDTLYQYDQVLHSVNIKTREQAIIAFIRLKYSQDDEFALTNKGIANSQDAEYIEYRNYVNWCKEQADVYFGF
jgi:oligoendopeptidase F